MTTARVVSSHFDRQYAQCCWCKLELRALDFCATMRAKLATPCFSPGGIVSLQALTSRSPALVGGLSNAVGSGQSHAWGFSRKAALKRADADGDCGFLLAFCFLKTTRLLMVLLIRVEEIGRRTEMMITITKRNDDISN